MKNKVIIHVYNGLVNEIYSNVDLEYIVIDEDKNSEEPLIIGNPTDPIVDKNLSIKSIEDSDIYNQALQDKHPWI